MNHIKTFFLLTVLTGLLLLMGNIFGGRQGMIIALIFAFGINFISYWYSDKIVLAIYKAKPAERTQYPALYSAVEELAAAASIPVPEIYILPAQDPNAFATGRSPSRGAVAVTEGLLRILNTQELKGVIAHELSHIKNRDTLIQTVAATVAGAVMVLASMARWSAFLGGRRRGRGNILALIAAAVIMPIAAMFIQMAISRSREYTADRSAAGISGNPVSLAEALRKLQSYSGRMQVNQATSHLFIVQPFKGGGLKSLFSTHPPIEDRIERLMKIGI